MHIIITSRTLDTITLLIAIIVLMIYFAPLGVAQWMAGKLSNA